MSHQVLQLSADSPSSHMITPSSHSRAQHVIIYTKRRKKERKKSFLFFFVVVVTFFGGAAQNIFRVGRDDVRHYAGPFTETRLLLLVLLIDPGVVVLCFPLTWLCKVCWYSNNVNIIMLTSTPTPLCPSIKLVVKLARATSTFFGPKRHFLVRQDGSGAAYFIFIRDNGDDNA